MSHPCLLTSRYQLHVMLGCSMVRQTVCCQLYSSTTNPLHPLLLSTVNQKSLDTHKQQFQNSMGLPLIAEHLFHLLALIQTLTIHPVWQTVKKYLQREIPSQFQLWTRELVTQNIKLCLKSCGVTIQNENSLACSLIFCKCYFFFLDFLPWIFFLKEWRNKIKTSNRKCPEGRKGHKVGVTEITGKRI